MVRLRVLFPNLGCDRSLCKSMPLWTIYGGKWFSRWSTRSHKACRHMWTTYRIGKKVVVKQGAEWWLPNIKVSRLYRNSAEKELSGLVDKRQRTPNHGFKLLANNFSDLGEVTWISCSRLSIFFGLKHSEIGRLHEHRVRKCSGREWVYDFKTRNCKGQQLWGSATV